MFERKTARSALLFTFFSLCAACRKHSEPAPTASATPAPASASASARVIEAAAPASRPAVSATGPLELSAPRVLTGTGLELALPKGAVRAGRPLVFSVPGRNLTFSLSHSEAAIGAEEAVGRAAYVFGLKQEFEKPGKPWELSKTPVRFAINGEAPKDLLGTPQTGLSGIVAAETDGGRLCLLRASFTEADRPVLENMARSMLVHPTDALDPLGVHGLRMQLVKGYKLKAGQLEPYVLPEGETAREGIPSLDLRLAGPSKVAELFEQLFATFQGDATKTQCEESESSYADGKGKHRRQKCVFASGRGPYRVRTDVLEDAQGGVISVMTQPAHPSAGVHIAALEEMVETLRLEPLPNL